jgi:general secretion pathway protein F
LSARDLALGLGILATLREGDESMSRVLATFAAVAPRGWTSDGVRSIHESVREGKTLAAALRTSPFGIPPLVIGMIQAGEAGGLLAESVRRAATVTERTAATRAAIRGALVYLAAAGALSVMLLIGLVLPRFAAIVAELGQQLPSSTRFVLAAGDAIRATALPGAIGLILATIAGRQWMARRGDEGRAQVHEALLAVPVVGPLRRAAAAARATVSMGALLRSGVALPAALGHASRAAGDAAVGRRLIAARDRVIGGERLSSALRATDALTPGSVQLVRAGEATGRVAEMLEQAGKIEGEWTMERVNALVRIIEPALILIFGAIVATIAAALLQAVYSVRPVG